MQNPLRIWLTYAHADNKEGDFSYVVQQLEDAGVECVYDRAVIVPGHYIWRSIADEIDGGILDAWAILVTKASLNSQGCLEELEYAVNRAIKTKGQTFPLIGLLHNVSPSDLPASLQVRLCVSLQSETWREEVLTGLQQGKPFFDPQKETTYVWKIHPNLGADKDILGVEIRPRFGSLTNWRILVPKEIEIYAWGHAAAGGSDPSTSRRDTVNGDTTIERGICNIVGAGDYLTPSISAYVYFQPPYPEFVGFTYQRSMSAPTEDIEIMDLNISFGGE